MYALVIKNNKSVSCSLRSEELYLSLVKKNGLALLSIPKHLLSKEICLEAVRGNGIALQGVPNHLKTDEICMVARNENNLSQLYSNYVMKDEYFLKKTIVYLLYYTI